MKDCLEILTLKQISWDSPIQITFSYYNIEYTFESFICTLYPNLFGISKSRL